MKKQKTKKVAYFFLIFSLTFLVCQKSFAAGSAYLSWTASTDNSGGSGVAGYKIYYNNISSFLNFPGVCLPTYGSSIEGTEIDTHSTTANYFFSNNLTPGQTYYFTVAAYDAAGNKSGCATAVTGGGNQVSKIVSYSGDLNSSHGVDIFDYNILKGVYNTSDSSGDINRDGSVNIFDYNILKGDYNLNF